MNQIYLILYITFKLDIVGDWGGGGEGCPRPIFGKFTKPPADSPPYSRSMHYADTFYDTIVNCVFLIYILSGQR